MIQLIKNYLSKKLNYSSINSNFLNHPDEIINGSYHFQHGIINRSLIINGEAILENEVSIQQKMIVNGSLKTHGASFEAELLSNGTMSLINSKFHNKVFFSGVMESNNSIFLNSVNILGNQSIFEKCQIDSIIIRELPITIENQKIQLKNGSIVNEDIIFTSGQGKVYADATSVIKGKIIGGDLVLKN